MITVTSSNHNKTNNSISIVARALEELEIFTNTIESKVDGILKAQEAELIISYKAHMYQIKQEFDELGEELKRKDMVIKEYENGEKIAAMIKRVHYLEAEEKKLLSDLEKRKMEIRELNLEKQVQKSEINRLSEKIKEMMRSKASMLERYSEEYNFDPMATLSSKALPKESKKELSKMVTAEKSLKLRSIKQRSEKTEISMNPESSIDFNKIQRQLFSLKKQNRDLVATQSKNIESKNELESFFMEIVGEMKKNISTKKQIKECSLDDFKKEDKVELLMKILSNEDVLLQLHSNLFGKQSSSLNSFERSKTIVRPLSLRTKLEIGKSPEGHFPSIASPRVQ